MSISELTRRNLFDELSGSGVDWCGRLDETEFLSRIYDLHKLPSTDRRFKDAEGDIIQHRVFNIYDWPDNWVYYDERFQLNRGPDEVLLRFCCEMVHPIVRSDSNEVVRVEGIINKHLNRDGWEIGEAIQISGLPVFAPRQLIEGAEYHIETAMKIASKIDAAYLSQQITRIKASIDSDPELAIGTSKELVETICKTILTDRQVEFSKSDKFPSLVKKTVRVLNLAPDDIDDRVKAIETIRQLLSNLSAISNGLAELRNPYGSGHGKDGKHRGLQPRHARLAAGAGITLATFLFETFESK